MKQSIDFNSLGDKHKALEKVQAGAKLVPGVPVIARLDGRAFHTVTRNAVKPFDSGLIASMKNSAKSLLTAFQADVAYCQSDEITLVWKNLDQFDMKIQKMCSLLAAHCSVVFNRELEKFGFITSVETPIFDCRIWQVADLDTATENLLWRQWDAFKNSVSMAAHAMFSNKDLHGKHTGDKINMMRDAGYEWHKLPMSHRSGSFFWKIEELKTLTSEELSNIPEQYRPTAPVLRSVVKEHEIGRLTAIKNGTDVIFHGAPPVYSCDELNGCDGCTCGKAGKQ